jgi:hypothetical protein
MPVIEKTPTARYWTRQWREIESIVTPENSGTRPDGR